MEEEFFFWKTNTDFQEMLNRPEVKTGEQIRKSEFKRTRSRLKRLLKNKHKKMLNSNEIVEKLKKRFTPEHLRDLKSLSEHDGWKVLVELAELHKIELGLSTTNINWDDAKQVKILKDQGIYLQAMTSILKIPGNMEEVETFAEYKESDIMPMYDAGFDPDDDEPNDI